MIFFLRHDLYIKAELLLGVLSVVFCLIFVIAHFVMMGIKVRPVHAGHVLYP